MIMILSAAETNVGLYTIIVGLTYFLFNTILEMPGIDLK
jgi:hypothetical protein